MMSITAKLLLERVVGAIENIAKDKLTHEECEQVAAETMMIIDEYNRAIALTAVETVKQSLVIASQEANKK